ncbi:hypothetical protein N9N40_09630 [Planktomarina temperata]|nr:hypothetical protein [Planktomarina temperata]
MNIQRRNLEDYSVYKIIASMFAGLALSACGGGGSSGSGVGSLAELNAAVSKSGTNANKVIQNYSSDHAVVALKGQFKTNNSSGEDFYVFALTQNAQTIIDTFNGAINYSSSNYTDFNGSSYYGYNATGSNANGQAITSENVGFFDGDTDVGAIYAVIGGTESLMSFGYTPSDLPAGTQTYSFGDTRILYRGVGEDSYNKSTLIANFNTRKGSLIAETETLFMSATDFNINTATGEISGGSAKVGALANSTDFVDAQLLGAFAGKYGDGAHGIIHQTADTQSAVPGSGIFYVVNTRLFE